MEKKVYAGKDKVFTGFNYNSGTGVLKLKRKKKGKMGFMSQLVSPITKKFTPGTKVDSVGGGMDSKGDFIILKVKK